jgi:hypothetical protein
MTIWLFLEGCCFLGPLFFAVDLARAAHAGFLGYALSLLCASLLGLSSTAIMWWAHSTIVLLSKAFSNSLQNVILMAAFVAEGVWVGLTYELTGWILAVLMRHVHCGLLCN